MFLVAPQYLRIVLGWLVHIFTSVVPFFLYPTKNIFRTSYFVSNKLHHRCSVRGSGAFAWGLQTHQWFFERAPAENFEMKTEIS